MYRYHYLANPYSYRVNDGICWTKFSCKFILFNRSEQFPLIRFKISYETEKPNPMTVFLIRGGEVIQTIQEKPPIEIEYLDKDIPEGEKTYYRIMDSKKFLTSNPIFVVYNPDSSS